MPDPTLPRFVVIGAVKAATTWTAHQLRQHPQLWLPDAEPHYFSSEYGRGPDWYRGLFADAPAGRIRGEKSADYLAHPDAPARLARMLPDAALVAQLRNPIDRAYSDYCMLFRRGMVSANIERSLTQPGPAEARFLEGGLYAEHIRRWRDHFPAARILAILVEEIEADPAGVVGQVCRHIGVQPHFQQSALSERKNDSTAPMLPLTMRRALRPFRPLLDPLRTNPVLARLRSSMTAQVRYPPLTPDLRARLRSYYRDDIGRTADLLGRNLDRWLDDDGVPGAAAA